VAASDNHGLPRPGNDIIPKDSLRVLSKEGPVTDDRSDRNAPLSDRGALTEWIESVAAAEDVPPEAVIERLVSSYWTLTEVHDVLGGAQGETAGADFGTDATVPTDDDAPTAEDIEAVRECLDRLEADLDDEPDARGRTDADLAELIQRVDAVDERVRIRQDALESRLDAELDNLETILDYFLDTTDALEADVESIAEDVDAARQGRAERERLGTLKRTASQLDVRSAACGHCGSSVDIGLLPTADCPHCDRQFVDIDPATGWFGLGTDTLVTARDSTDRPGDDSAGGRPDGGADDLRRTDG
jgi:predicted Zn-ribbon and HTH transcriptional regulator